MTSAAAPRPSAQVPASVSGPSSLKMEERLLIYLRDVLKEKGMLISNQRRPLRRNRSCVTHSATTTRQQTTCKSSSDYLASSRAALPRTENDNYLRSKTIDFPSTAVNWVSNDCRGLARDTEDDALHPDLLLLQRRQARAT